MPDKLCQICKQKPGQKRLDPVMLKLWGKKQIIIICAECWWREEEK